MAIKPLSEYKDILYGCRFCPMCKPAAEVANVTLIESHTTRARAMMLWREVSGMTEISARDAEILFQSTLDSISQAWCVHHYPVSEYVVSARHEVLEKGCAPEAVKQALNRPTPHPPGLKDEVIFLAAEAAELGSEDMIHPALALLEKGNIHAEPVFMTAGFLEYSLGAVERAADLANQLVEAVKGGGVKKIIADGPSTLRALTNIFPVLDSPLPAEVAVVSLTEELSNLVRNGLVKAADGAPGSCVMFHDSRSVCMLSDEMAEDQAILPDFNGPEDLLGKGAVYETPRAMLDALKMERVFSVWSRSLSKSCGIEGGLWATYPDLARRLGEQRLEEAKNLGASMIVTDSPLCARQLSAVEMTAGPDIRWLPELLK